MIENIQEELFRMRDSKYAVFQSKLIPNVPPDFFIGVRTPELRKYAKQLAGQPDVSLFLQNLPHRYFDENQLHAFIISEIKDFERCIAEVSRFLPYIDNWATCDQLSPKVFRKNHEELLKYIETWISSGETYTVRFAVGMLMEHFLGDDFDIAYSNMAASVTSDEYYVRMMVAWYFATALAKQYDAVLPFIENRRLDPWTHNKAIQKAVESYRITDDQKTYLKQLKIKKDRSV